MEINKIPELVKQIALQYGYPIPTIKMNNKITRKMGVCHYLNRTIELNTKYCRIASDEQVINLLKHEIAHLRHPHHGETFKNACQIMGTPLINPSSLHPEYQRECKYQYQCPNGHIHGYNRILKREYSCGVCLPKVFDRRFILKRIK